ncbi:MAG: VWA domain-containing protein [Bifidobacteriaceae bacterium]|jgi:hypothetical protein|nr:VWA domain-containing protein [Bifidobacteriaceae bacterium]
MAARERSGRRARRRCWALVAGLAGLATVLPAAGPAQPAGAEMVQDDSRTPLILMIDVSSSMDEDGGAGTPKLEGAKQGMIDAISGRSGNRVGLWTYPGDGNCSAGGYLAGAEPIERSDSAPLKASIRNLTANGNTPTAQALEALGQELREQGFTSANIVLVSDGESNCEPPRTPCEVAQDLVNKGFDVTINTIGFQISDAGREELTCIADQTSGRYVDITDSRDLIDEIQNQTNPILELTAVATPDPAAPGDTINIAVTAANTSTQHDILAVTMTLSFLPAAGSVALPVIPPRVQVGTIPAGEVVTRTWPVASDRNQTAKLTAQYRAVAYGKTTSGVLVDGAVTIDPAADDAVGAHAWGVEIDGDDQIVVMGDSYSSGEGTWEYEDPSTHKSIEHATTGCHVSQYTYSYDSEYRARIIACSGAVMNNFSHRQVDSKAEIDVAEQLRTLDNAATAPRIVFLTIGGNDIGFADVVTDCVSGGCDMNTDGAIADAYRKIEAMSSQPGQVERDTSSLAALYREVWAAANSQKMIKLRTSQGGERFAPVVVLPYPTVLEQTNKVCEAATGMIAWAVAISVADVDRLIDLQVRLNRTIMNEVANAAQEGSYGIFFANGVENATLGYSLCRQGDESYFNHVTFYAFSTTAVDHESVHPTKAGYTKESVKLRTYLNSSDFNFNPDGPYVVTEGSFDTQCDEFPLGKKKPDWGNSDDSAFPKTELRLSIDDDSTKSLKVCEYVRVSAAGFAPGSSSQAVLNSAPVVLANLTADENGEIDGLIGVPPGTDPGIHHISVEGTDPDGEPLSYTVEVKISSAVPWYIWAVAIGGAAGLLGGLILLVIWRRRRPKASQDAADPGALAPQPS